MDLSNLSDADLEEIAKGEKANVSKLSDQALEHVAALPSTIQWGLLKADF